MSTTEAKVKITKLGGKARGGGRKPLNEEVEAKPGEGRVSNRWAGLMDSDDDDEEEEGGGWRADDREESVQEEEEEVERYGNGSQPRYQEEEEYVGGDAW